MPLSSLAFKNRFEGESLFELRHTDEFQQEEKQHFRLSYKTDEEKKTWFDGLPQGCQNWGHIQKNLSDWTFRSTHLQEDELPSWQTLDDAAVKQRWEQAEEDWRANRCGELSLTEAYRDNIRLLRDQGGSRVWNFMVFGLPSLSSQSFGDIACRQYWFVMTLIAALARWFEEPYEKRSASPHKVEFDTTHVLSADLEWFRKELGMLTNHLAVSYNDFKPPVPVEDCTLREMFREVKTRDLSNIVLIMLTPFNPVRQLINHILSKKYPHKCPAMIVCTRVQNSNVIPSIGPHSDTIRGLYSGDPTSDLVEKLFGVVYYPFPLIADATLKKMPSGYTDEQKKEIKDIFGDIALYVRRDHFQRAFDKNLFNKDPWEVDKEPDQKPQAV